MKYRIGSFNMRRLGNGANPKKDFEKIAEIIQGEKFDIVALQEIFSQGKGLNRLFERNLRYQLSGWERSGFGKPRDSKDTEKIQEIKKEDSGGEGYVFLWKKNRFRLAEYTDDRGRRVFEPRIVNSIGSDARGVDCSSFARTPYYIRLQPVCGGFFEFRLIDIHIFCGDDKSIDMRRAEYDKLTKEIYPKIAVQAYGVNRTPYTIAMGDYNLNLCNPLVQNKNCCISEIYSYQDGRKNIDILTVQDGLTTLRKPESLSDDPSESKYANNFDHFTYSPQLSGFTSVSYEVVDAVNKYCGGNHQEYFERISDHLPIAMDVEISGHTAFSAGFCGREGMPKDLNRRA